MEMTSVANPNLHYNWFEQIALVGQEPVLYGRSIKDNIAYGMDVWDMDQVTRAAIQANAHSFVIDMKDQYDTEAGEKGTHLSGKDWLLTILITITMGVQHCTCM